MFLKGHGSVVNHLFGSQPCYEFKVSCGRGSCHARATKSGELDREDANRTGSPMHQHRHRHPGVHLSPTQREWVKHAHAIVDAWEATLAGQEQGNDA